MSSSRLFRRTFFFFFSLGFISIFLLIIDFFFHHLLLFVFIITTATCKTTPVDLFFKFVRVKLLLVDRAGRNSDVAVASDGEAENTAGAEAGDDVEGTAVLAAARRLAQDLFAELSNNVEREMGLAAAGARAALALEEGDAE